MACSESTSTKKRQKYWFSQCITTFSYFYQVEPVLFFSLQPIFETIVDGLHTNGTDDLLPWLPKENRILFKKILNFLWTRIQSTHILRNNVKYLKIRDRQIIVFNNGES